jgi:hypothetical protein
MLISPIFANCFLDDRCWKAHPGPPGSNEADMKGLPSHEQFMISLEL